MYIIVGYLCFLVVITILLYLRCHYTYKILLEDMNTIRDYCDDLIKDGIYDINQNYFEKMTISYHKYFWSIWLWGKDSTIKPEYKEMIRWYQSYLQQKEKNHV